MSDALTRAARRAGGRGSGGASGGTGKKGSSDGAVSPSDARGSGAASGSGGSSSSDSAAVAAVLKRVGVKHTGGDVEQIMSADSESDGEASSTPPRSGGGSSGQSPAVSLSPAGGSSTSPSDLSLPSFILADLNSPEPYGGAASGGRAPSSPSRRRRRRDDDWGEYGGGSGAHGGESYLLDAVKKQMSMRIRELEEALDTERAERRKSHVEINRMRAAHDAELRSDRERYTRDVSALREAEAEALAQVAKLRVQLDAGKEAFRGSLVISEAGFEALARVPEESLSVLEYVQKRVHEVVAPLKDKVEQLRKDLDASREAMTASEQEADRQARELHNNVVAAESRVESMRREMELANESNASLTAKLAEARSQIEDLQSKGVRFDAVAAQLERATSTAEELDSRVRKEVAEREAMQEERNAAARDASDLRQQLTLLQADKTSLKRAADYAEARVKELSDKCERQSAKLKELKRAKENFHEELMRAREDARGAVEERLMSEVARLQETSSRELEQIRANSRDVYDRENRALREARAEAVAETERLRSRMDALQKAHDTLVMSQRSRYVRFPPAYHQAKPSVCGTVVTNGTLTLTLDCVRSMADAEGVMAELRGQLKLKAFEHDRLSLAHEEQGAALREARNEAEMLRKKVEVLREEFSALEAESTRRSAQAEAQLAAEREKVATYERLEVELDSAILTAGSAAEGGGSDELALVGGSIPTAARRRVRQSILLAQRLLRSQSECEALKQRVVDTEKKLQEEREAREALEGTVETAKQPQAYLIQSIRQKDADIAALQRQVHSLTAELTRTRKSWQVALADKQAAEEDAARVLRDRQGLDALRAEVQAAMAARKRRAPSTSPESAPPPAKQQPTSAAAGRVRDKLVRTASLAGVPPGGGAPPHSVTARKPDDAGSSFSGGARRASDTGSVRSDSSQARWHSSSRA